MMRIITGTARGARLETLEGETTRPTAEKTKMAIFNTLQFDIEGRKVLDLFGGSGQLALEALSRGAENAFICECDRSAFEIIKRNAQKTKLFDKVRLVCTDYKSALKSLGHKEKFGIIFLDPPYKSNYIEQSLRLIIDGDLLDESGYVVCETENSEPVEAEGLNVYKHSKYGRAYVTILTKKPKEEDEE
jgi:16S rRNA (guanine(966)-N(2))-methyltransferase RsmD